MYLAKGKVTIKLSEFEKRALKSGMGYRLTSLPSQTEKE